MSQDPISYEHESTKRWMECNTYMRTANMICEKVCMNEIHAPENPSSCVFMGVSAAVINMQHIVYCKSSMTICETVAFILFRCNRYNGKNPTLHNN